MLEIANIVYVLSTPIIKRFH